MVKTQAILTMKGLLKDGSTNLGLNLPENLSDEDYANLINLAKKHSVGIIIMSEEILDDVTKIVNQAMEIAESESLNFDLNE